MPHRPAALVLRVAGTNCDVETAEVLIRAGADATALHFNRVAERPGMLADYDMLVVPGGFSYGDDIGSGVVFAHQLRTVLRREIESFLERGGLMLGICNGFQVLLKAGLLTAEHGWFEETPSATLTWNGSARYEDRWVRLLLAGGASGWIPTDSRMECPVRHAEGRFVTRDEATYKRLEEGGQLLIRYADTNWKRTQAYPANPNGSQGAVAGMCSRTGQVLALMPHPECNTRFFHHPEWTREPERREREPDGLRLFRAGIEAAASVIR